MSLRALMLLGAGLSGAYATPQTGSEPTPLEVAGSVVQHVTLPVKKYGAWRRPQGDGDMGTEGDEKTQVRFASGLEIHPSSVMLTGTFQCREVDKDWSTFEGPFAIEVFEAPPGYEVARIQNPATKTGFQLKEKQIGGKRHGPVKVSAGGHWTKLELRIDTDDDYDGHSVGFKGVLDFDVVLIPRQAEQVRFEAQGFGGYLRTGDDDEMETKPGKQTQLDIRSELILDAGGTAVRAQVSFFCREAGAGKTTFQGERLFLVYQPPSGSRVREILDAEQYTQFGCAQTIKGEVHAKFPVPVTDSHWSLLECQVDQWFGEDSRAVGFIGTLDFQVVLEPAP